MIQQTYHLNLVPGGVPVRVHVSQYDVRGDDITTGRRIAFALYNGADPFTVPTGSVVTVDGLKPDRKGVSYTITYTSSTNEAYLHLNPQLTAVPGDVRCRLTIRNEGAVLGSASFILVVEKAPIGDETDMSGTDISVLETLAQSAAKSAQAAKNAADSADAAVNNAVYEAMATVVTAVNTANTAANNAASAAERAANSADVAAAAGQVMARGTYGGNINAVSSSGDDTLYPNSVVWVGPSQGTTYMPLEGHGYCVTLSSGTGYVQEIYYTNGAHCRRLRYNDGSGSAWKDWEWVAPPMVQNTEYLTTERYFGKPVYTKIFNLGAASTKQVIYEFTGTTSCRPVRCEGVVDKGNDYYTCPLLENSGFSSGPRHDPIVEITACTTTPSESTLPKSALRCDITVRTDYADIFNNYTAYAKVWYTKS